MDAIKIEKGIEIPSDSKYKYFAWKSILIAMEVGDSFKLMTHYQIRTCRESYAQLKLRDQKYKTWKFKSKVINELSDGSRHWRVWRIK